MYEYSSIHLKFEAHYLLVNTKRSSAVAERPCSASCRSVVSLNSSVPWAQSFISSVFFGIPIKVDSLMHGAVHYYAVQVVDNIPAVIDPKARYWSKITIFAPRRNIAIRFGMEKLEWCGYWMVKKMLNICVCSFRQNTRLLRTPRQTDGRTPHDSIDHLYAWQKQSWNSCYVPRILKLSA